MTEAQTSTEQPQSKYQASVILGMLIMELLAAAEVTGVTVLLPTFVKDLQISPSLSGIVLVSYVLPFALLLPFFGRVGSAGSSSKLMHRSIAVFAIASLVCTVSINIEMLLIARFFKGGAAAGIFASQLAVIIEFWDSKKVHATVENVLIGAGLGFVIGPILAGFFAQYSWRLFFGVSFLLSSFIWLQYRNLSSLKPVERAADEITFNSEKEAHQYFWKILLWPMILYFVVSFATMCTNVVITLHLQNTLSKSAFFNGGMLAIVALGVIIAGGAQIASKVFKENKAFASWFSGFLLATAVILLPLTSWISWPAWILYLLIGIATGMSIGAIEVWGVSPLPFSKVAIGTGYIIGIMQLAYAIAAFITPELYKMFGTQILYIAGAIIIAIAPIYMITKPKITQNKKEE